MHQKSTLCTIVGCNRFEYAKLLCNVHYQRVRDGRDPSKPIRLHGATPAERYLSKIDRSPGLTACHPWTGAINSDGYGSFNDGEHTIAAHVFGYTTFVGPIPEGFTIDHICHNGDASCRGGMTCLHRRCQNKRHWEAVSNLVNMERGKSPMAINARKTHCVNGHLFDEANTMPREKGYRSCRTCHREKGLKWEASASKRPCTYPECERPVKAQDLCLMHYKRFRKGTAMDARPRAAAGAYQCSIEGCPKPSWNRGWCRNHYAVWYRAHKRAQKSEAVATSA